MQAAPDQRHARGSTAPRTDVFSDQRQARPQYLVQDTAHDDPDARGTRAQRQRVLRLGFGGVDHVAFARSRQGSAPGSAFRRGGCTYCCQVVLNASAHQLEFICRRCALRDTS